MKSTSHLIAACGAALIALPALVAADDDHEAARRLRESGQILPLEQVLERVRTDRPGRVIESDLDEEAGRWIYEIEVVDDQGAVWELEYDASTGELLRSHQDFD